MLRLATIFLLLICSLCQAQSLDFLLPVNPFPNVTVFTSSTGSGTDCSLYVPCTLTTAIAQQDDGDIIGLKAGDTYITGEHALSDNNIDFVRYGSGPTPIMTALVSLSGATWTSEAGGFYSTPVAASLFKWLYINNAAARYGETSWLTIATAPTSTTRTVSGSTLTLVNGYNSTQSLVDAKIRFKEFDFRMSAEYSITNYNSGTGTITVNNTIVGAAAGMAFKMYGQAQWCTLQGDWYYDSVSEKVFVKSSTSPAGTTIAYSAYNNAFNVDGFDNISISGIEFIGYQEYGISIESSDNTTIEDVTIHDLRGTGIKIVGDVLHDTIRNVTVYNAGINGIEYGGFGESAIMNCTIHHISTQDNLGWPRSSNYPTGGAGIAGVSPDKFGTKHVAYRSKFWYNNLSYLAYAGILFYGENSSLRYNVIHDYMMSWLDGGGIHTFWVNVFDRSTTYDTIANNIIYNAVGDASGLSNQTIHDVNGIYIDNRSEHLLLDRNTIYNTAKKGILFNFLTANNTASNNNISGNGYSQIEIWQNTAVGSPANNTGNILLDNVLMCTNNAQRMVTARTDQNITNFNPFASGGSSSNYYIPYTTTNLFAYQQVATLTDYTLSGWQTKMSSDATSTSIVTNRKPTLGINATSSTSSVDLSSGDYTDVSGNVVTGLTLSPFSSQVYLSLDLNYKAVLTYSTGQGFSLPTIAGQRLENERTIQWKESGFFAAQDIIYCTKTFGDRGHAKVNYKNPGTKNLVEVGTLTYVTNVGFRSDGLTGYLDTNFVPSTDGVNYTLNNAMISFYSGVNEQNNNNTFGATDGSSIISASVRSTGDQTGYRINHFASTINTSGNSSGCFEWKRTDSNAVSSYRNVTLLGTGTNNSISLPSVKIFILAINSSGTPLNFNPSTKDVGFFAIGSASVSGCAIWNSTQ